MTSVHPNSWQLWHVLWMSVQKETVPTVMSSKYADRVGPRSGSGTPVKTGRVLSESVFMRNSILPFCWSSKAVH